MSRLIDRHGERADTWVRIDAAGAAPADADCLLTLAQWQQDPARWSAHPGRIGIELGPADDPSAIADALESIALLALRFPKFTDGRGYSIARLLRDAHGWRGELRAVGDVLHDQLYLMARCGFDTFELREDQDADAAIAAFTTFSTPYQRASDRTPTVMQQRFAGRDAG